jgi:hypothetical protein
MHQMSHTAASPLQPEVNSNGSTADSSGSSSSSSSGGPAVGASPNAITYGSGDVHVLVHSASSSASPILTRQRSETTDAVAPWDDQAGDNRGDRAPTYLPAPPSPRTPNMPVRRKNGRTESPAPQPPTAGERARRNLLSVPPALGLGVQSSDESPQVPLLSRAEQVEATSSSAPRPSGDEVHADDIAEDGGSASFNVDSTGEHVNGEYASPEDAYDDDEEDDTQGMPKYQPPPVSHSHKLGQWMATGICGNDITSSCLYVTGLCVADAGVWAPICLLMVVVTLYLFRAIYGEAVTALPLNGGAYNVLL